MVFHNSIRIYLAGRRIVILSVAKNLAFQRLRSFTSFRMTAQEDFFSKLLVLSPIPMRGVKCS